MTPAERLIAAADLLEKQAGEATDGPWWMEETGKCRPAKVQGGMVAQDLWYSVVHSAPRHEDATYIATMHPEAGKRQAAILRAFGVAVEREWRCFHEMWKAEQRVRMLNDRMPGLVEALDLADLLLAGAS